MVSSTAPRLGPRWPPVLATLVTRASRISAARTGSWSARSARRSAGPVNERSNDTTGQGPLDVGGDGEGAQPDGRPTVTAFAQAAGCERSGLQPGHPAFAAQRPGHHLDATGGPGQPGTLPLVGTDRRLHRVWGQLVGQLHPHRAPAGPGRLQARCDVVG